MPQGASSSFIWLLLFFALMYFLMIRPQQKQKKQRQELLNNLEKGDKIVTIGGIHGTITSLTDETMVLEIAPNLRITMQRSAVGFVKVDDDDDKKSKKGKENKKAKEIEEKTGEQAEKNE
ncbi:MAG: preprotein translocase subunit YajC [Peptococcaceae bacterium]|jgi:preprotein translocase subunit YajC|nr:preprotein translocase subunit YajC [Peptococcaceae bacterium]MDH7525124.1 preprotein translocase subunit YajC [Peptococcaceae bacterium]